MPDRREPSYYTVDDWDRYVAAASLARLARSEAERGRQNDDPPEQTRRKTEETHA